MHLLFTMPHNPQKQIIASLRNVAHITWIAPKGIRPNDSTSRLNSNVEKVRRAMQKGVGELDERTNNCVVTFGVSDYFLFV